MKNQLITLPFAALLICTVACKKKDTATTTVTPIDSVISSPYPDYMRLKQGNYWVYEQYSIDSATDPGTALGRFDSCYALTDTLVRGNYYHRYCAPDFANPSAIHVQLLRDSLSYVVTEKGKIVYSSDDFSHIFSLERYSNAVVGISDTIDVTTQMAYKARSVTVPAGTFITNTYRQLYHFSQSRYLTAPDRSYDYTYALNIGQVKATIALYSGTYRFYEHRLVRYHLQ